MAKQNRLLLTVVLLAAVLAGGCGDAGPGRDSAGEESGPGPADGLDTGSGNGLAGDLELIERPGETEIKAEELVEKAAEALARVNSYSYRSLTTFFADIPALGETQTEVAAEGRTTLKPRVEEVNMELRVGGDHLEAHLYFVEDTAYLNYDDSGWVRVKNRTGHEVTAASLDLPTLLSLAGKAGVERAEVTEEKGNYVIVVEGVDERLQEALRDSGAGPGPGIPDGSWLPGETTVRDVYYMLRIDGATYLPAELVLTHVTGMEFLGQELLMEQSTVVQFLEFGTFEEIRVPDEVIEEAVSL